MMKIKLKHFVGIAILSIFLLTLMDKPTEAKTYTIKIGTIVPANSPWGNIVQKYTAKIKEESKGQLDVKVYWNSSLGSSSEMLRMLRTDRVQVLGIATFSISGILPELQSINLPYLFDSDQEAERVLDGPLFQPIAQQLNSKGFELLGWMGGSWSGIGTKTRFIKEPDDLKGLKIGIPGSDFSIMVWKRLGGNAIRFNAGDILNGMQTKMVDGFVGVPEIVSSAQWYKTIKYYTYTKEVYVPGMVIANKQFWSSLPPNLRTIFQNNINGMIRDTRQQNHVLPGQIMKEFTKLGIQTHAHTAAERNLFRSKTLFVRDEFKKQYGGNLLNLIVKATK